MSAALIQGILEMILQLVATFTSSTSSTAVQNIIKIMEDMLPAIIKDFSFLYDAWKNALDIVSKSPATNQELYDRCKTLDAKADADFEAAADDTRKEIAAENAAKQP